MSKPQSFKLWAMVPAAGVGSRMQSDIPKQYLPMTISDNTVMTVLEVTLHKLLSLANICGAVVTLASNDETFSSLSLANDPRIAHTVGGDDRATSVLNGLAYLTEQGAHNQDWVLVHDAARPCVSEASLRRLFGVIEGLHEESTAQHRNTEKLGAILAAPVADTLKASIKPNSGTQFSAAKNPSVWIQTTVPRDNMWQAHTPQCFRLGDLYSALESALSNNVSITDEASAIEYAGGSVQLVEDARSNIKITRPEDMAIANFILQQQKFFL